MRLLSLGPNGALIYCMEYLEQNFDWLYAKLEAISDCYVLFDCPGQVELYTHNACMHNVFEKLCKKDMRLVAAHLVDAHYCAEPYKFISAVFASLSTMLQIGLPHINVLSKVDLLEKAGKLAFNLDFFTDVLDMNIMLEQMKQVRVELYKTSLIF